MPRRWMWLLLLVAASFLGCSGNNADAPANPESIPDIPPGRSALGPEAGDASPVPRPN